MRREPYLIIISILIACLAVVGFFDYAGSEIYAQDKLEETKEIKDIKKMLGAQEELVESKEEIEKRHKEEEVKHVAVLREVHKKIIERTSECQEILDSMIFTIQSLAKQAYKKGETKKEKELLAVLTDYNSVKGDLDAIGALLDMAEFAEDREFSNYFDLMAQGYEYLEGDFNLKNELFLRRISELKDKEALGYEKKLYSLFCKYFEHDLWQDREIWPEPEIQDKDTKQVGEEE